MERVLHHVPGSRSLRIVWLLEELGLDYRLREWSITDGGLRGAEYLSRTPAARVPALETDGRVIWESGAICEYLTEQAGRLAPAPGAADRADFLQWLHYAETHAAIIQSLNIHHIFLRPETARSPVLMRLETRRLAFATAVLEQHLRGRDSFLDGFSAVDCMFGFNVLALFHFLPRADYPVLDQWWRRMQDRPALQRALAHDGGRSLFDQPFYEVPDV